MGVPSAVDAVPQWDSIAPMRFATSTREANLRIRTFLAFPSLCCSNESSRSALPAVLAERLAVGPNEMQYVQRDD